MLFQFFAAGFDAPHNAVQGLFVANTGGQFIDDGLPLIVAYMSADAPVGDDFHVMFRF